MRTRTRLALAAGFVGAVATAATAFGQVGEGEDQTGGGPPRRPRSEGSERGREARRCGRVGRGTAGRGGRVVHGELKVRAEEGFALVVIDVGSVTAVDHARKTLTVRRSDGQSVTATAGERTRVCKDGRPAAFDAIKVGDLARVVQVTRGGETVLRAVRAHSPEAERARAAQRPPGQGSPTGGLPSDRFADPLADLAV